MLSIQTFAVFACTAVPSFGLNIALSKWGIFDGLVFHYRVKFHGEYLPNNGGFDVPWAQFLGIAGVEPDSIPFFFSVCAFYLLLGLVPGVPNTIRVSKDRKVPRLVFNAICVVLIVSAFLIFEHIAHAYKPFPRLERRLRIAGFMFLGFGMAFGGFALFLWVSRILLRRSRSTRSVLGLVSGLLYVPLGLLLLLPSWSYWATFWIQDNMADSIWAYPSKHLLSYKYFEWALSLCSQMNLVTVSLALLVVVISAFLLLLKVLAFVVPRSIYVTSNAIVEDNRGKFAVAGLSLLAIAFPYMRTC